MVMVLFREKTSRTQKTFIHADHGKRAFLLQDSVIAVSSYLYCSNINCFTSDFCSLINVYFV